MTKQTVKRSLMLTIVLGFIGGGLVYLLHVYVQELKKVTPSAPLLQKIFIRDEGEKKKGAELIVRAREEEATGNGEEGSTYIAAGNEFHVDVFLNAPNKKVAAVDIDLSYNLFSTEFVEITPGEKLTTLIEEEGEQGTVRFSLLAPAGEYLQSDEEVIIATLKFKAIPQEATNPELDLIDVFATGIYINSADRATDETNIGEFGTGKDILKNIRYETQIFIEYANEVEL
jgi:hypothetical protein